MSETIEEVIKNNEEMIRQRKALAAQAKARLEENASVYEQLGITRDNITRFASSDQCPAEAKRDIEEVERDIEQTLSQIDAEAKAAQGPQRSKPRRPRNMI